MQKFLFIALLLPFSLFGQDPLFSKEEAKSKKVKSVKIITLFLVQKDGQVPDTATTEIQNYDSTGNLTYKNFHNTLDKNDYTRIYRYTYDKNGQHVRSDFDLGNEIDSIIYTDSTHYIKYRGVHGKRTSLEIKGDSVIETSYSENGNTEKRWVVKEMPASDNKKVINAGQATDTMVYFSKKNAETVRIVNHRNAENQVIETEYFNKGDKDFYIYSACYNPRMNMVYFLPVNKKGERVYRKEIKYNEKGLVSEIHEIGANKGTPAIITYYEYSFY